MTIPSNFSLDEILKVANLTTELATALELAFEAEKLKYEELEEEVKKQDKKIEQFEELQGKVENLIDSLERELKCSSFRYTETKNLAKKCLGFIEESGIEV